MAFDQDKSFDVDVDGIGVRDSNGVLKMLVTAGDSSPVGSQAPVGSRYFQTDGQEWKKHGSGANDWRRVSHLEVITTYNDLPSGVPVGRSVIYTPFNSIATWDGNHWIGPSMGIIFGRNRSGQFHAWLQSVGKAAVYPRIIGGSVQTLGFYTHEIGSGNNWKITSLTGKSDQAITGDLEIHQSSSSLVPAWASTGKARLQFSNQQYQDSQPSGVIIDSHARVSCFFRYTSGTWDNLVMCMNMALVPGLPA
jgi:hypothetical protein